VNGIFAFKDITSCPAIDHEFLWDAGLGGIMTKTLLAGVAIAALLAGLPGETAAKNLKPTLQSSPMMPVFSWTGCFVGGQGGWGWQRSRINQFAQHSSEFTLFHSLSSGSVDTSGAVFGGQIGCNLQLPNSFVVGVQGTFLGTDINGTVPDPHNGAFDIPNVGLGDGAFLTSSTTLRIEKAISVFRYIFSTLEYRS